jgi:hypothetical protein
VVELLLLSHDRLTIEVRVDSFSQQTFSLDVVSVGARCRTRLRLTLVDSWAKQMARPCDR